MFCYQCEEALHGKACTTRTGVCGKDEETAALQDLLVYVLKGIGQYMERSGRRDPEIDRFTSEALFVTLTNVNFDPDRIEAYIRRAVELRDRARGDGSVLEGPASFQVASDRAEMVRQGQEVDPGAEQRKYGEDAAGLRMLVLTGLKGLAAYAHHAADLGEESEDLYAGVHRALATLARDDVSAEELLNLSLEVGGLNLEAMRLLDAANTGHYGHPEPTQVRVTPKKGKAILVSGHDLRVLEQVLEQTKGTGINVYTHGEMLPANAYPGLKKYSHLVGNYGHAWWQQGPEFAAFPGAILMTTNCLQRPRKVYKDRLFTYGVVGWPGVRHLTGDDYSPLIEAAMAAEGFAEDGPDKTMTIGFGHHAVLSVADKVIDAVKTGAIKHFFVVGGCDARKKERAYYTEFVSKLPENTVVLTMGCGKYRINHLDLGDIGGIPRLLDLGQCNDSYSAIRIAQALAEAFGTDVNGLPLSLNVAWYEQKAAAILLTLLHLGIKNIKLGPTLPAFLTERTRQILIDNFGISTPTTPEQDIRAMMGDDPSAPRAVAS